MTTHSVDMLDLGGYPEIYADGIGDVFVVADMAHIMLFRWRKIDGEMRRCVVAEVIRPVSSVAADQLLQWYKVVQPAADKVGDALCMH